METIAIVGDGAMGTVCSKLLVEKGFSVRMWTPFVENAAALESTRENRRFLPGVKLPAELRIATDPAEAFVDAKLALSAVPCQFTRAWWRHLKPHYPGGIPICSATKGIENNTLLRATQILAEVLTGSADGDVPLAVLSGPCIAREVAAGLPATVVAASSRGDLAAYVQQTFTTSRFRVYTNPDLIGVELAGATKNIIAIAAGILDGLRAGDNAKAALLTRGLAEITRLGAALGGRRETFAGLAGLGDLVTTCVSPHGRNRSFGESVGRGKTRQQALDAIAGEVEGVATTKSVLDLARRHGVEMPITQAVHAVVFDGQKPAQAITELMSRPLKGETD